MTDTPARPLRSLYLCYLSLDDPLVHTQVVAYLAGLAASGHEIHLLTFETARLTRARRDHWRAAMAEHGIAWHGLRYHKRPSLPATVYDALAGGLLAARLVRRHRLDALHARSHVPAAMALIARRLGRRAPELIFDIRGLWAEEYEDAGRWKRDGAPFMLTKAVERSAIARAGGVVVLTHRVREQLFGHDERSDVFVIPCCADLRRIEAAAPRRAAVRAELGLPDAPVLVYVGKFGGWYMEREMAEFFRVAGAEIAGLHFLVVTQGPHEDIERELRAVGADGGSYTITSVSHDRMGEYLAAADCAISFVRPSPSKASSSPTKIGEYLAGGLPIVATAGVGDIDRQLDPDVGVLLAEHGEAPYGRAARRLGELMADPGTAERCRAAAHEHFSLDEVGVPRYRALYETVSRARSVPD
jgi:glycosyltransferase involved in cell wall biosynthesis